ncbi:MAG: glycosyltransferase [Bacteroidetes bacterium]|nr:glycosyltransferase [Bacteroidota bacterium]
MTILLLLNRVPYPLHDGGALAMDAMIRGYRDVGCTVHVLAMNTSRHFVARSVVEQLYPQIDSFHCVEVNTDISKQRIIRNLLFSRQPEHLERFTDTQFEQKLEELLNTLHPDVVQLESPFLANCIPVIRRCTTAKIAYRMHNVEAQIWARMAGQARGLRRYYLKILAQRMSSFETAFWSKVDVVIPIAESDIRPIKAAGVHTPVVLAGIGFALKMDRKRRPLTQPYKLYHIGAMDWQANVEAMRWFLKEIWPELHTAFPQLNFYFAGRAMPKEFFEGLPDGVYCAGEVDNAEEFVADKDILVVPLKSGGGIRVKILEAFSQGKLVLSTTVGIQGIHVLPKIHFLLADTSKAIIDALQWVVVHPHLAQCVADDAQSFVGSKYNSSEIFQRLYHSLQALLEKKE